MWKAEAAHWPQPPFSLLEPLPPGQEEADTEVHLTLIILDKKMEPTSCESAGLGALCHSVG